MGLNGGELVLTTTANLGHSILSTMVKRLAGIAVKCAFAVALPLAALDQTDADRERDCPWQGTWISM
jgi:hypothetical protein